MNYYITFEAKLLYHAAVYVRFIYPFRHLFTLHKHIYDITLKSSGKLRAKIWHQLISQGLSLNVEKIL